MNTAASSSSSVASGTSFVILSVSIAGILAIALLLLSYYLFLTRCGLLFFWRSDHTDVAHHHHHMHIVVRGGQEQPCRGLQVAAIRRIPTFRYRSNHNNQEEHKSKNDCAVCLADFRDGERLRQLPPCRHAFHIDCIDAWLQTTANCPLCRATVSVSDGSTGQHLDTHQDDIVIEMISESLPSPATVHQQEAPEPCQQQQQPMRSRRSLSMDSSTDKRFYLALQRMLQQQQQQVEDGSKSPAATTTRSRSLRRSFFSFSHSRSATILPL